MGSQEFWTAIKMSQPRARVPCIEWTGVARVAVPPWAEAARFPRSRVF
ncbi:hypothetical protein [Scytonema sp. NUACC26]